MTRQEYWNFSRRLMTACKRAVKNGKLIVPDDHRDFLKDDEVCPLGAILNKPHIPYPTPGSMANFNMDYFKFEDFINAFGGDKLSYSTPETRMGLKFRKLALEGGFDK